MRVFWVLPAAAFPFVFAQHTQTVASSSRRPVTAVVKTEKPQHTAAHEEYRNESRSSRLSSRRTRGQKPDLAEIIHDEKDQQQSPPNYTGWGPNLSRRKDGVRIAAGGVLDNALSVFAEIEGDILVCWWCEVSRYLIFVCNMLVAG